MVDTKEQIIMTPKGKTANSTTIAIERRRMTNTDQSNNAHVGGGQHAGIVINKDFCNGLEDDLMGQLQLEFKVFLLNEKTQLHTQESRKLSFWFKNFVNEEEQAKTAQEFFKELVSPSDFPRDYVGFIKKIMKMMQHKYLLIRKTEIVLTQLMESEHLPQIPTKPGGLLLTVGGGRQIKAEEQIQSLNEEKLLEIIESAYPNPVVVKDIAKRWSSSSEDVDIFTKNLTGRGLIKALAPGCYTRVVQNETDVQIVRQMPTISSNKQPTIAIITAQYCEKLAVDSMIENQETFVRYTTVGGKYGESNVYTLGNIGAHRVVCTKLPQVGHDRSAAIAAGNTTTRLLGTFQKVEHVFLVGVAGGVPHYTDYYKHVRLGDVVVSAPSDGEKYIYLYCDSADQGEEGSYRFETKSWGPSNLILQSLAKQLKEVGDENEGSKPWLKYMEEGKLKLSSQEIDFVKPSEDTDVLYMSIGGSDLIQVSHPTCPSEEVQEKRTSGEPRIFLGTVASGKSVIGNEQVRQDFANRLSVFAFDQEFDAVVESVYGNRKDQYIIVRGICDYRDGTRGRDWQPIAALASAAFTKSIICALDPPNDED